MCKNSGFTIIEMMVVISILTVMTSIAIPGFINWLPNYRLRSGVEDIQSTLQLARLKAINQNTSATVAFDINNEKYSASVGGQQFRSGKMPAGVNIDSVSGSGSVSFDSQGFASSAVNIVVENSLNSSKTVSVKLTGNSFVN